MTVQRCAVVPVNGGRVQNIIMADPDVDRPYRGTKFVVIDDDTRCDDKFTITDAEGIRPSPEFEAKYYEEIRQMARFTKTQGRLPDQDYPPGSPEQTVYLEAYTLEGVR
jgi:hypothetical protein